MIRVFPKRAIYLRAWEDSISAQWARRTIARLGCLCLMRLFMVIPWRIGGCLFCLSGLKRLPWREGRDRASLKMYDSRRRLNWPWRCWTWPTRGAICCFSGSAGTAPTGMLTSFGSTLQVWGNGIVLKSITTLISGRTIRPGSAAGYEEQTGKKTKASKTDGVFSACRDCIVSRLFYSPQSMAANLSA